MAASTFTAPRRRSGDRDDRVLAVRAGRGDERAFAALYERHAPGLVAFASQYLGDRAAAEDAVQQTFLAAYRVLREGTRLEHPRAWLYHVTRNNALTTVRERSSAALEADLADELHDRAAAVPAQIEQREALAEVIRDMVALPAEQRAALALFELGDLSQAEIAKSLDCTPEKVKALVFQARSSLTSQREARSTSCATVREKLATFRGGALNGRLIRHHLRHCQPCSAYRDELRDDRRKLALLLPVLPAPGLRDAVLGLFGGEAAGGTTAPCPPALSAAGRARWVAGGTAASVAVAGVTLAAWPSGHDRRDVPPTPPPQVAAAPHPTASASLPAKSPAKPAAATPARRRPVGHSKPSAPAAVRAPGLQIVDHRVSVRSEGGDGAPRPSPVQPRPTPSHPTPSRPRPAAPAPAPPPVVAPGPSASPQPTATPEPALTPEPAVTPQPLPTPSPSACVDHSHASEQGLAHGKGHSKCKVR